MAAHGGLDVCRAFWQLRQKSLTDHLSLFEAVRELQYDRIAQKYSPWLHQAPDVPMLGMATRGMFHDVFDVLDNARENRMEVRYGCVLPQTAGRQSAGAGFFAKPEYECPVGRSQVDSQQFQGQCLNPSGGLSM